MSDILLESREVERLLDLKPSTLRWMAENLGSAHGKKGVARKWSLGDLTLLVIAQRLTDRGFTNKAAVRIARSLTEAQWLRLVTDDEARLWVVALPLGAEEFELHLAETAEDAFSAIDLARDPVVVDLRAMLEEAFLLVAEARKGARQ